MWNIIYLSRQTYPCELNTSKEFKMRQIDYFAEICNVLFVISCQEIASNSRFSFAGKSWQNAASVDGEEQNKKLPPVEIKARTSWLSCQCSAEWAKTTFNCQNCLNCQILKSRFFSQVFPKLDHSANITRIALIDWISCWINFC